jgi:hypothetical protein
MNYEKMPKKEFPPRRREGREGRKFKISFLRVLGAFAVEKHFFTVPNP